ncbi:prolyl-tRNA synthetase associated domain-containing protein [Parvularcula marina]|uniref:prolyl-tRNA synthetase associated domain-containing protein n=1 Tax=Parvularcula marina TaxID=2292771 RepID=UPI003519358E
MPSEDDLYRWFSSHGFAIEQREHPATPTVADAKRIKLELPPGHSKSLLVEEKGGALTLICARGEIRADLKALSTTLGTRRFSFAGEETMTETLGVRPGSLTPLALINDTGRKIARVVLDAPLMKEAAIWCHPLRNTASVGVPPEAIIAFITDHHGAPVLIDVAAPENGV